MINSNSLRRIFDVSTFPTLIILPDVPDFSIVESNAAFLRVINRTKKELFNKSIFEVFPEKQVDANQGISDLRRSLQTVIAFKEPDKLLVQRMEIQTEQNQRIQRYYEITNTPVVDENGEVEYIIYTSIDVTDREIVENHLRTTEERLLAAQSIAKVGYWRLDVMENNLFWSKEIYHILGINENDFRLSYDLFFQSIHPDDKQSFAELRSAVIAGEKEMDLELRIINPDGVQKWVHQKGKLVKNEKGELVTFEGTMQDVTESKLLKLSLEESNQRYQYVSKATFDAIYDWNLITDECYWGEGFQKCFGYDLRNLRSDKNFWESHVHPDDHDVVVSEIKKAVNGTKENWLYEYRLQKSDDIYAYVLDRGFMIRDKKGKAIRMVGAMQDITEKINLQELLDNANRLARLGSWIIDVEKDTIFWSDITKQIRETGKNFVPTLQDSIEHFKEGYSKDTIVAKVKEAIESGTSWQEDLQIYTQQGNLKWFRTVGISEMVNGKCTKIYGSIQDIDEQKKAELEIIKLYEEKNIILESIGDAFFRVDNNWIISYWNRESEKMVTMPKTKIVGQYLWDIFPQSVGSKSYQKYHESVNTNKRVVFEDFYPALGRWFEISTYPYENGLSVYLKNITERKLAQIQLNELHQNLTRTAHSLAISNAELEQFAYISSHDLQEPLRMITGFLTQLDKKYSKIIDEKGKQYISFAVDGAKKMHQIILDLLKFSRIGKFDGMPEEVDINELISDILTYYKKKIDKKKAIIQFDSLPVIRGYRSPLSQVFQNLISNALKYCKTGQKPVIKIAAEQKPTFWQFSVQDNGIGIDPDYHERIFVIFQRLHLQGEYDGTGIGLAIVKKIVEGMGGEIWVESKKGAGSTFFFTIDSKNIN